jgi:DNA-directed RNA polymerase subunit omega
LNAELCKKALEKVGNPNILVNLISKRVRQLCSGGGGRPLLSDTVGMGAGDIALTELIENKMGWETLEDIAVQTEAPVKKRKKS